MLDKLDQPSVGKPIEGPHDTLPTTKTCPSMSPSLAHNIRWKGKNWLSLDNGVTKTSYI
jgi:hypothetical protein